MTHSEIDSEPLSGNKIVRTFRMPKDLVHTLGREATQRGLDLTALVLRILQGYLTYFALPEAATAQLEADRATLGMDRTQYLAHLLYHRCLAIRERGLGFDDPHKPIPKEPQTATSEPDPAPPAQDASAAKIQPAARPLGAAGGGAHQASGELPPGTGVWPYGLEQKSPRRR